jgi:hypothetical protein
MKKDLHFPCQNSCNRFTLKSTNQNLKTKSMSALNSPYWKSCSGSLILNFSLLIISFFIFNVSLGAKPNDKPNIFIDKALVDFPNVENADQTVFQLFSHGRSGELFLDGEWKNAEQIASFVKARISNSSSNVNTLNIYGCEFAKDQKGIDAVNYLQATLNINIAASNNITGQDGDWTLELGESKSIIKVLNFKGNLQTTVYVNAAATGLNNGTSWANGYKTLNAALKANASISPLTVLLAAGTYNEPNANARLTGATANIFGGYNVNTGVASPATTPSILNYSALTISGASSNVDTSAITYVGTGGAFNMKGLTIQNLSNSPYGHAYTHGTSFFMAPVSTSSTFSFSNLTLTNNLSPISLFAFNSYYNIRYPSSTTCMPTGSVSFEAITVTGNSYAQGFIKYLGTGPLSVINSVICTNKNVGQVDNASIIYLGCGGLEVDNVIFNSNSNLSPSIGHNSGAIEIRSISDAPITISNSTFSCNTSMLDTGSAGAIVGYGTGGSPLVVENCDFMNNKGYLSGAVFLEGTSMVGSSFNNCTFNGHTCTYNGTLTTYQVPITVSNSLFANNNGQGGAVSIVRFVTTNPTVSQIINTTFINNTAKTGAGIYFHDPKGGNIIEVSNSNFTSNKATGAVSSAPIGGGGGIHFQGALGSKMIVTSSSFANNLGNAIITAGAGSGATGLLTVDNSTFSGNSVAAGGALIPDVWNAVYMGYVWTSSVITNSSLQGTTTAAYTANHSTVNTTDYLGNTGTPATAASTVDPYVCNTLCVIACKAGTEGPVLSSNNITNTCPSTTVDLTPLVTSTSPLETSLVWFTNETHTGTAYTTPTEATAGTYYAFYFDEANNCYSPASVSVTVTILNCNSCKLGGTAWYDYNGEGNPADGMQGAFPIGSSIEKEVTGAETIAPANINNIAAAKLVGVNATFPYIGGVANVQTTLYNATTSEFVASKVTDSKGNYIFTNLTCDNYYMVTFDINGFTAPDGVAINAVAPNQGTNNLKDSDGVYDLKAAKFVTEPVLLSGPNAEDYSLDFGVSAAILPIVLKSFDGNGNDCKVALTWVTSIEKDNKQFIVERSLDGSKFVPVGTLAGKRNSSEETTYTFTDANIAANGYYYRLIQEDIDGTRSIVSSKYISSACQKYNQTGISGMYPNPVSGNVKTLVKYNSNLAVNGILTLMSMEGKVLITQNHQFIEGINNLSVDLSTLPAGSYIIQVSGEGLPLSVKKLLKTE